MPTLLLISTQAISRATGTEEVKAQLACRLCSMRKINTPWLININSNSNNKLK